ncbi:hypothetical protein vBAspPH44_13 [Alteromonas phage vB_AspP-H4/4]|uniref:Uncharacterized protein n=1 Tax=Alteromonas phage vB_AspP-H4/4 TaxID=2928692 RepID=A0A220YL50_9CAUD|nr:hypothetical protein HOR85_gp13 [Alteromonas phage vB_AspP-H4/4]ASL24396.1 hypothetical protein vBAspPH44_13 [Alteromonas phage vB_AspP-H4/4]
MSELTNANKVWLYRKGYYQIPAPPVQTVHWTEEDWINFIDSKGIWFISRL